MDIKREHFINAGIIFGFLFLIFSFLLYINVASLATIDYKTTVLFQDLIPNFFILPFSTFSIFGSAEFTGIFLLIMVVFFIKTKRFLFLGMFVILGIIEILGKTFIHQPGPPLYFHKTSMLLGLPSSGIPHDFFAYPSGHSARTAFVSGILILVIWFSSKLSKELKILLIGVVLAFDFVMYISRVYLGEHWASDVLGGVLLGYSLAFIMAIFFNLNTPKSNT